MNIKEIQVRIRNKANITWIVDSKGQGDTLAEAIKNSKVRVPGEYYCPLCDAKLVTSLGNLLHPGDVKFGYMLFCPSRLCPAQEVSGHGGTVKEAFEIIQHKFKSNESTRSSKTSVP
jgi:hypothetical protein